MKKILLVLVALSLCMFTGQAMAKKVMTPESLDGISIVDADWVKKNIDNVSVFDARKKGEYVEGHIKGAISAPYNEKSEKKANFDSSKDKWDIGKFPASKDAKIVVYCNGVKCWKSYKSLVRLKKAGYKRLYWLRDGFPGWQEKGYPVE